MNHNAYSSFGADIVAQLARGSRVVVHGKMFIMCKELVAARLHLPLDGPVK